MEAAQFQEIVWQKGRELFREMPWRQNTAPYYVLVSELMLQQTQVERVVPKFLEFIEKFPSVQVLAGASLGEVLAVWSGLGYNRRAKFLHEAAKKIVNDFDGTLPGTFEELKTLPGVGVNTAGAILAYSFNQPSVFIETNIRTVFFHHFFAGQTDIADDEIRALVGTTLDDEHPREWYWALMDYGSSLKRQGAGRLDTSKHYKKQPPLKGSLREVRGQIIKKLAGAEISEKDLRDTLEIDERFNIALAALLEEGLVARKKEWLHRP